MIDLILTHVTDIIFVRVDGTNVTFGNAAQGKYIVPIENLQLSEAGIIKEFPDLKNNPNKKQIAIERFKEKIKSLPTEKKRAKYIIQDLEKQGYKLKKVCVAGNRPTNAL